MLTTVEEMQAMKSTSQVEVRDYAERLLMSMGYNDAICTAMEFQWFNVAEELRFMQDDYRGVA